MASGELFADLSIVAGLTAAGAYLIWLMCQGRDDARDAGTWQTPWGEVVDVPEVRPARDYREGDSPETNGLADTQNHADASYQRPRGEA